MKLWEKLSKRMLLLFMTMVMLLGVSTVVHAESVKIRGAGSITVGVGLKKQTSYTTNPEGAALAYRVEQPEIASVDANGVVKGLKEGTTRLLIHAYKYGSYSATTGAVKLTVYRRSQTITTSSSTYTVTVNQKIRINAKSSTSRSYKSANTAIAKVDKNGIVTGVSSGTTYITIKAKDTTKFKSASKAVKVTVNRASQVVTVSPAAFSVEAGKTVALSVSAKTSRTYSSSNTSVATVDSSGRVYARSAGTAFITVKAKATSKYLPATFKVKVTVKETAATPYMKLKNVIQSSTKRNSSGNRFISGTMSSHGITYTYGVVYLASTDQFQFVYTATGDSKETVSMVLSNPNTYSANPQVSYLDSGNNGSFQASAVIYMNTFTGNGTVNVEITNATGVAKNYPTQNKKAANIYINNAFSFWNAFLQTNVGITIRNLGFTAYVGQS